MPIAGIVGWNTKQPLSGFWALELLRGLSTLAQRRWAWFFLLIFFPFFFFFFFPFPGLGDLLRKAEVPPSRYGKTVRVK